jgi:hypothetical protein
VTVVDRRAPGAAATPDALARAWRDAAESVHLLAADPRSRTLVGPDLHRLTAVCVPIYQASGDPVPSAFDDLASIGATWTDDDTVVHAQSHVEYQGHRHPSRCPARLLRCMLAQCTHRPALDRWRQHRRAGGAALGHGGLA